MIDLGGFPALVSGSTAIAVEIFAVDSDTLCELDMLEGEPLFYQRLTVTLPEFGRCYMYILSDSYQASLDVSELVPVQSGCWVENS